MKTMRAVWSFWSKPYRAGCGNTWPGEFHHALAWALSLQEAGRHYPDTWLHTDDYGARLLVDTLRLPFANVRTDLNILEKYDPAIWNLGKIHAFRLQREPFFHIDADAFLWLPLPDRLTRADVFCQNPVPFRLGKSCYCRADLIENTIAGAKGWLPEEWKWFRPSNGGLHGESCGLIGGNRVDFFRYVYDLAFAILDHPGNSSALKVLRDKVVITLEECLPAACIGTHRARPGSPFCGIGIEYLFDSPGDVFKPTHAGRTGYAHLLGGHKRNPAVMALLEDRVVRDNPGQYEHFEKCFRA